MTRLKLEDLAHEVMTVLPQINRLMAVELRQEVDDSATMPQFRVLAYLHEAPMTLTALAQKRRVSLQSAGELVQALVARGWVLRTPDPSDRRQSILELTDEGRTNYARVQNRMQEQLTAYLALLTDTERDTVQGALIALQRVIQTQDSGVVIDDSK
ncbi:MAG: MarR family transcriptional regulator [Chloroflexota bacterium]